MGKMITTQVGSVPILVEAVIEPGVEPTANRLRETELALEAFSRAQEAIEQVAVAAVEVTKRLSMRSCRPDQMEIQFGLKFSAQGNVVLASAATEASLSVKIVYESAPGAEGYASDVAQESVNTRDQVAT